MVSSTRFSLSIAGTAALGVLLAWSPSPQNTVSHPSMAAEYGFAIKNQKVIDRCSRCHEVDDEGRMSRISYLRKSPEGWQTSIRRMVALHGARLNQEDARDIARYLANEQGLAPEEMNPGRFEVERRSGDHDWGGDSDVEYTCIQCHSMGRVITQRRTADEWGYLLDTHRSLYPLVDFQAFRYSGPASEQDDPRHPMDRAISHLSESLPLETAEWSAWSATKRSPRLAGTWALSGYEIGKGPIHGTVTITADPNDSDAFTTSTSYVYPESGQRVERTGQSLVYTGYQWRGRSNPGADNELREVMFVERDQQEITGRWFSGNYDEMGPDVTLRRAGTGATVTGVYPMALRQGGSVEVRVYGADLTAGNASDLDFGAGISVASVSGPSDGTLRVQLSVAEDAAIGGRDLFAFGALVEDAVIVHDGVDRIAVTPETGMARTGGIVFPKGFQTFEAVGFDNGPDGEPDTGDDLNLGRVEVSWVLEEYATTFGDDDIQFVGAIDQNGVFNPAPDGPNPDRAGNRNNIGDVWVVATHRDASGEDRSARSHLIVTVPLYMRFEPWREIATARPPVGEGAGR
jgi:quinohemoprotein amine dehydrogenase